MTPAWRLRACPGLLYFIRVLGGGAFARLLEVLYLQQLVRGTAKVDRDWRSVRCSNHILCDDISDVVGELLKLCIKRHEHIDQGVVLYRLNYALGRCCSGA